VTEIRFVRKVASAAPSMDDIDRRGTRQQRLAPRMIPPGMTNPLHRRLGSRLLGAALLATATMLPSCATVTGVATGAFTGFIDLPNEIIAENQLRADAEGTWIVAMFAAPVGFVLGPAFGLVKGVGVDINTAVGNVSSSEAFGTYERVSIWRPYTFDWDTRR